MKKNKMMRTASGLLVATLLTTSVISGTFAKYVSEGTGSDTARVAKWGVTAKVEGATFATAYDNENSATVKSADTEKVVAPGTEGSLAGITLSGTPEVKVKVSYKGAFELKGDWTVNDGFYCPLVITVKSASGTTEIKQSTNANTTKADFVKSVNDAIASYSQEYDPNTNLVDKTDENLTVTWKWPFSGENDAKDTDLGNTATKTPETKNEVKLDVTATVTQVD